MSKTDQQKLDLKHRNFSLPTKGCHSVQMGCIFPLTKTKCNYSRIASQIMKIQEVNPLLDRREEGDSVDSRYNPVWNLVTVQFPVLSVFRSASVIIPFSSVKEENGKEYHIEIWKKMIKKSRYCP